MTYAEVLGRPASAIIAALTVGFISIVGQGIIEHQQRTRAYTQLMSQWEEAESGIRKDMSTTILRQFFSDSSHRADDSSHREAAVSDRLEQLELLALNFSGTLSLSPLFRELDRTINREGAYWGLMAKVDRAEDRRRLRSLAKRVNEWQLSRLAGASTIHRLYFQPSDLQKGPQTETFEETFDGIARSYRITLSNPEPQLGVVDVHVFIIAVSPDRNELDSNVDLSFSLSYYDFPLIDNIGLSHNQRVALVLSDFAPDVRIQCVVFPGEYATQRESPTLRTIIQEMHDEGQ